MYETSVKMKGPRVTGDYGTDRRFWYRISQNFRACDCQRIGSEWGWCRRPEWCHDQLEANVRPEHGECWKQTACARGLKPGGGEATVYSESVHRIMGWYMEPLNSRVIWCQDHKKALEVDTRSKSIEKLNNSSLNSWHAIGINKNSSTRRWMNYNL